MKNALLRSHPPALSNMLLPLFPSSFASISESSSLQGSSSSLFFCCCSYCCCSSSSAVTAIH